MHGSPGRSEYKVPTSSDPTFTSYTPEQAQAYAQARLSYPRELYEIVINHHKRTGGQLTVLVDIGCGPGLLGVLHETWLVTLRGWRLDWTRASK